LNIGFYFVKKHLQGWCQLNKRWWWAPTFYVLVMAWRKCFFYRYLRNFKVLCSNGCGVV